MCWLDKKALETMQKLKEEFKIRYFMETGTYKGVNAAVHAHDFEYVFTCDINEEFLKEASKKLDKYPNVYLFKSSSPDFLLTFIDRHKRLKSNELIFVFLDAHFYDPALKEKWVVRDELKALEGFDKCIICIHDFDCEGLGHCKYEGESLGFPVVGDLLKKVNPNFKYYTNTKEFCEIYTEETIKDLPGLELDEVTKSNIQYAWSNPEKTYRGILYAVPADLDLTKYNLKKQEWN